MRLLRKISSIAKGFKNYVFENEEAERIAKERAAICASCSYIREYEFYRFIGHYGCSICKCAIATKTRSLEEECPHPEGAKWKAVKPQRKAVPSVSKE